MSEDFICADCGLPIHPSEPLRHLGFSVTHHHSRCVALLRYEIERLQREIETHKLTIRAFDEYQELLRLQDIDKTPL